MEKINTILARVADWLLKPIDGGLPVSTNQMMREALERYERESKSNKIQTPQNQKGNRKNATTPA